MWGPVANHPGYIVSRDGRVIGPRGHELKPHAGSLYPRVTLYAPGGKGKPIYREIHALMLETFVGPREDRQVCRHLNGNRQHNRLENLRWGTPSENSYDSVEHGTHPQARKTQCVNGHDFTPENTRVVKADNRRECRKCRADFDRANYESGKKR